jgi:hypothetical protein
MDTNSLNLLVALLERGPKTAEPSIVFILGLLVPGLLALLTAAAGYLKVVSAKKDTEETKKVMVQSADSLEKIHVAVNSAKTALEDKIAKLTEEVLQISKENATLKGEIRISGETKQQAKVDAAYQEGVKGSAQAQ